jgi:hypothetical protein
MGNKLFGVDIAKLIHKNMSKGHEDHARGPDLGQFDEWKGENRDGLQLPGFRG